MTRTPTETTPSAARPARLVDAISSRDRILGALTVLVTVAAALARSLGDVAAFIAAGAALALLAAGVGRAVEALGDRVGPAATGILQSALGNLPELLILVFALRQGLIAVVQATIVGSILANVALVLGVAFIAGGLRHGTQQFSGVAARDLGLSLLLAVAALSVPSLTAHLHTPAASHERVLSQIVSVVLIAAFGLSVLAALRPRRGSGRANADVPGGDGEDRKTEPSTNDRHESADRATVQWPLWLAVVVLAVTGVLAALVSDWFVQALKPAMDTLNISDAFAGLVIVAIAGNAVENFVGIQLALKNRSEHALQVVLQSPLQIAMVVAPVVLLLSPLLGAGSFTLVLPPLLLASLLISALIAVFITFDGESTWYEGVVLVALYGLLAASFWWG
ncbi:MAG: calcium/proton exchanger [Actinomycetota bacterium]|nr:calcium/proton exchanger [Actinomycetota bacterium]